MATRNQVPGIDLAPEGQLRLLESMKPHLTLDGLVERQTPGRRFYLDNDFFRHADAVVYRALLAARAPRRVIEVGSGFSSALLLDALDDLALAETTCTFVEPNPERLHSLIGKRENAEVIQREIQDVPIEIFLSLEAGDFVFIDGSHVSKTGSDVNHLMLEVLPLLPVGVLVHIHDIFWPFDYPRDWVLAGRAWNEAYLVRAFLAHNEAFRVLLFNSYLGQERHAAFTSLVPGSDADHGGSLWLERC